MHNMMFTESIQLLIISWELHTVKNYCSIKRVMSAVTELEHMGRPANI